MAAAADDVLPDVRAAYAWLADHGRTGDALRMAIALGPYWLHRARFAEGVQWLDGIAPVESVASGAVLWAQARGWSVRLAVDTGRPADTAGVGGPDLVAELEHVRSALDPHADDRSWLRACEHLSYALRLQGMVDRAWSVIEEALDRCPPSPLDWWRAELLHRLALLAQQRGDGAYAVRLARAAIDAADAGGNERLSARAAQTVAVNGGLGDDRDRLADALIDVLARSEACGDVRGVGTTLPLLGAMAWLAGDTPAAAGRFLDTIRVGRASGYWHGTAIGVFAVAALTSEVGDWTSAARLHGALSDHLTVLRRLVDPVRAAVYDTAVVRARPRGVRRRGHRGREREVGRRSRRGRRRRRTRRRCTAGAAHRAATRAIDRRDRRRSGARRARAGLAPERGSRIAAVARDGRGIRWFETEVFWVWHVANAFETVDGDATTVTVDYPYPSHPGFADVTEPARFGMVRARLQLATGVAVLEQVDDLLAEFPRIDDRRIGRPYRYLHVAGKDGADVGRWDQLRRHDTETGAVLTRRGGSTSFGEAVFAPRDGSTDESDGYVLTYGYHHDASMTTLIVLHAGDITGEPAVTLRMPQRVPFGLHGSWVPSDASSGAVR